MKGDYIILARDGNIEFWNLGSRELSYKVENALINHNVISITRLRANKIVITTLQDIWKYVLYMEVDYSGNMICWRQTCCGSVGEFIILKDNIKCTVSYNVYPISILNFNFMDPMTEEKSFKCYIYGHVESIQSVCDDKFVMYISGALTSIKDSLRTVALNKNLLIPFNTKIYKIVMYLICKIVKNDNGGYDVIKSDITHLFKENDQIKFSRWDNEFCKVVINGTRYLLNTETLTILPYDYKKFEQSDTALKFIKDNQINCKYAVVPLKSECKKLFRLMPSVLSEIIMTYLY